ncbi:MAG TPA: aldo/keto reductase [Candidatus Acidoferrales bacterium]|nr:aldo/keto reductase [Candidatus Acidoferrales bacterium]
MSSSSSLKTGCATSEGTRAFAARFDGRAAPGHFRDRRGLMMSSIGIGTYLGEADAATDRNYTEAVSAAVHGGVNVVDAAINYRLQRSERSIGSALEKLFAAGFAREEILICTKAGFLTPDGDMPADANDYFFREYISKGIFAVEDIAAGCHCMTPRYLQDQIERSRRNLGISCVDVFYLHNPETQLGEVPRDEFSRRLVAAFETLEAEAAAGKLRAYGMATWNAFRNESRAADYLSLEQVVGLARQVAGSDHRFHFVQLPFNLAMPEALMRPNQTVGGKTMSMVQAARELGVTLIASASLLQSHLIGKVSAVIHDTFGLKDDLDCALQFVRSAPGIATALVGMKRVEHVKANLRLAGIAPASQEQFRQMFAARR